MSGLSFAVPLAAVLNIFSRVRNPTLTQAAFGAGAIALLSSALDFARMLGHTNPWSVGTQVPSLWGHTYGPWKGAMRYGFRLGVGPATILTSWTWWGAMLVVTTSGQTASAIATAAAFVIVRSTLTVGVGLGVTDGSDMAQRMKGVIRAERPFTLALIFLTALVGCIALAAGQQSIS